MLKSDCSFQLSYEVDDNHCAECSEVVYSSIICTKVL